MEEYKKWSREVDQQITPKQPAVHRFDVYEIKGAEKGTSPYDIVEDIDVESFEKWQETLKGKGMERVVREWDNYGDGSTNVMVFGEKI